MSKRKATVSSIALAALALALQPGDMMAHHTAGHDQNPNPPAPLGTTDIVSFTAGSLIVPMDACYQRMSFVSSSDLTSIIGSDPECNGNNQKDDGIIPAYSLMFRLVMAGIPVHWGLKAGKTGWHDVDFSITRGAGSPVVHKSLNGSEDDRYDSLTQIDYRGAPFIIAADNAAAALTLMNSLRNTCHQGTCYDEVDVHEAQVDFDAPIYSTLTSMPKLAIINLDDAATGLSNTKTGFLSASVEEAMMDDLEGTLFDWVTIPEVNAGKLINDNYALVWVPAFDLGNATSPTGPQATFFSNLTAYVDNGGNLLAQDAAVATFEGHGTFSGSYSSTQSPATGWQSDGGLLTNGPNGTWDNGSASETTRSDDYSDPASQFGGMMWTGIGGSKYNWMPRTDRTYRDGVRRQVYTDSSSSSADDNWEVASWRHLDNDTDKGRVFYLGGYNWRKNTAAGFRLMLNTVLVSATSGGQESSTVEVSRGAPIIATVDGTETHFQGSYTTTFPPEPATTFTGSATDDAWEFPHVSGHIRAIAASAVPDAQTALSEVTALFDGADGIPTPAVGGCANWFTTSCRTVFTHTAGGAKPARVFVKTSNASALGPYLGSGYDNATLQTLVSRILAGKKSGSNWVAELGGIDRSTPAVIEPSVRLGLARPTMIYVGGLDGMLHAFCADDEGDCTKGKELWAFIPRQQLGLIPSNAARVDGSPTVSDVFADFDNDGDRELRTVLTFQTGSGTSAGSSKPAVYALDVTDPTDPTILWELVTPDSRGDFELGVGLNTAMAPVRTASGTKHMTFIQTNNGGTAGSGFVATAVETATGTVAWTHTHAYPTARATANSAVPSSAVPGGPTVFSTLSRPTADTMLVPSIYGDLWVLDPATGTSKYTGPIFRFGSDFHPIGAPASVYRDRATGNWRAIVVSGGYADKNPITWSPSDVEQFGVGFDVAVPQAMAPLTESSVTTNNVGWTVSLGIGRRAFAQAVIAGNELFIVTDSEDVNLDTFGSLSNTGLLQRFSLSDVSLSSQLALGGGGASIDVSTASETAFVAGGASIQKDALSGFDRSGSSAELPFEERGLRMLWLRSK